LSCRDRDDDLMMDHQALDMSFAVGLAGAMVAVIPVARRTFFETLVDILDQPILRIVDVHAGRDMHGGNQRHSLMDPAPLNNRRNLIVDIDVFAFVGGVEPEIIGDGFHSWSIEYWVLSIEYGVLSI